jgi:hypothetical protein
MGEEIPLGHRKALLLFLESVRNREEKVKQDEAEQLRYQEEKAKQKEKKQSEMHEKLAVISHAQAQPSPPPVPSRATITYKEDNLRLSRSLLEQMERNMADDTEGQPKQPEKQKEETTTEETAAPVKTPVKKVAEKKEV